MRALAEAAMLCREMGNAPHDRPSSTTTRREFLALAGAAVALPFAGCASVPTSPKNPFTLGVASGDPDDQSVVLWTRLAPEPLAADGGMGRRIVEVAWEIAEDEGMQRVIQRGLVRTGPDDGHSVHVEPASLPSDAWLHFRFSCDGFASPIGRTRTMPKGNASASKLTFALASCQSWEQGLFTAYEAMQKDELDLVVFVGDYIYEYASGVQGKVRLHHGPECTELAHYRVRYAQYRTDPMLQGMHARCPWLVTWDDHEVDNNYAGIHPAKADAKKEQFLRRRGDAYRAYWENMPLRATAAPKSDSMRLHRRVDFGTLATFFVLDARQYRTDQPNGDKPAPLNAAALDPRQTMLGDEQEGWLQDGLAQSRSVWNVLAQQVMMAMVSSDLTKTGAERPFKMDQWPGYAHQRMELLQFLRDRKIQNPVVLTGDIHSNWCNELRVDDRDASTPVVATEFVATSISSGGDGEDAPGNLDALLAANPCVRFHNQQRGYLRCTVTQESWTTDYVVMDRVKKPGGTPSVRATFAVKNGDPRAQRIEPSR